MINVTFDELKGREGEKDGGLINRLVQHSTLCSYDYHPCDVFEAIDNIYLDKKYFVGFCQKSPDGFKNLGAIQAAELTPNSSKWKSLSRRIGNDCYWTINSLFKTTPWIVPETGLNNFKRNKDAFKRLNALWVDFDVGRPEDANPLKRTTPRETIARFFAWVEKKEVPEPSIIAFSGRGIYCMWLLDGFVEANSRNKRQVEKINKKLVEKLSLFAPDSATVAVSQILRFPGVVHSKTGNSTEYYLKEGIRYNLEDFEDFFELDETQPESPVKNWTSSKLSPEKKQIDPRRLRGVQALNRYYCEDILKIEKNAGGFKEGGRHAALIAYVKCIHNSGIPQFRAVELCEEMAARCDPPCKEVQNSTIQSFVKWVYSSGFVKFSAKSLCKRFDVTPELARTLNLRCIVPAEVKAERSARAKRNKREQFVSSYRAENPNVTVRQLAFICTSQGFRISRQHLGRLLKKNGVQRRGAGRPKCTRILLLPQKSQSDNYMN